MFNSPIEASTIDEFAEGRSDEQPVFEKVRRSTIYFRKRTLFSNAVGAATDPLAHSTLNRRLAYERPRNKC